MSTSDRLLLILHVGFAIFTLGPLTAATMATPRYIRHRNVGVLRYLHRATRLYGLLTLGIFLFGLFLAKGQFAQVWLSASMTLFIVAIGLLLLVERDQRRAIHLLEVAAAEGVQAPAPAAGKVRGPEEQTATATEPETAPAPAPAPEIAQVERGRIAAISGVIALLWLVILILMIWYGR
ncbi:hypothetical protein SAMN04489712_105341 [Thermomonospora echinospora]|uniref:DUF2269 family protein n=1 Tax=Thermomonospora echinospora TaxID=1992 RepID=A0A1H6AC67_9ACTN|nr:hypothetical protein [Thermomonospora echinospora]SEG46071.1 hypothetical protein SAMN04489712_105341 [Thermomonospora echinospora]